MTLTEFWIPLTTFALVGAFTPGPNNLMLAASGMNFGLQKTVPHIAGVTLGFPVILLSAIFGVGALLTSFPVMREVMRIASAGFILYFAWKIATTEVEFSIDGNSRPFTFRQAALFQCVNPKAWAVSIAVASLYAPAGVADWQKALSMVALFFIIGVVCCLCWTSLGMVIRSVLQRPVWRQWFNRGMALVLVVAMVPILLSGL